MTFPLLRLHYDSSTKYVSTIYQKNPQNPHDPHNPHNPQNPHDPHNPQNPQNPQNSHNPNVICKNYSLKILVETYLVELS